MNEKKFMVFIYIISTCKINICIYFSDAQILKITFIIFNLNIKKKKSCTVCFSILLFILIKY